MVGVLVARLSSDVTSWDVAGTGGEWGEGRKKCDGEVTTETVQGRVQAQDRNAEGTKCVQSVAKAHHLALAPGESTMERVSGKVEHF